MMRGDEKRGREGLVILWKKKKKKKKKRNRFLIAVLPISEGIDPEISFPFRFLLDDRGERKEDRKNE